MSHKRNLRVSLVLSVATLVAASAPSARAAVCNEATPALRGNLVATGTPDPNPPARYTTDLKALGNGNAQGLERAADRSPALTACVPISGGGGEPPLESTIGVL